VRESLDLELARWVGDGLLSAEQAEAIRGAEQARDDQPALPARPPGVLAEVLGSLGAIAAAIAAVVGTVSLWGDLSTAARVAVPAFGALALFAAGAVVPLHRDASTDRFGALLWLLACGALTATTVIVGTELFEWDDQNVILTAGIVTAVAGIPLLWLRPTVHLHLPVVGSMVAVAVGLVHQYDHATSGQVGAVLVCVGLVVMVLGWGGVLPSFTTSALLGAGIAFVGTEMTMDVADHWPVVVGLGIAAMLLVAFVADRRRVLLVLGLIYAIVFVAQGIIQATQRQGATGGRNLWIVLVVFTLGMGVLAVAIIAMLGRPAQAQGQQASREH